MLFIGASTLDYMDFDDTRVKSTPKERRSPVAGAGVTTAKRAGAVQMPVPGATPVPIGAGRRSSRA